MSRHVLAVLHGPRGAVSAGLVLLPGEPDGHPDLEQAAGVPLSPAGPALSGDGVVLHRCRGPWDGRAGAAGGAALAALVELAVGQEDGRLPVPVARARWQRSGWDADVLPWVDDRLSGLGRERVGPPQVVHSWAISHVLRLPTATGPVWLKASAAHFAAEPGVTEWLAQRHPGAVPEVLATDPSRGLLLMQPLPGVPASAADLVEVGALVARLQLASAPHRDELARIGVPARSLAATADRFAEVVDGGVEIGLVEPEVRRGLRAALPWVHDRCAELAAHGVPELLCHGDLHLGNVVRTADGPLVYDWSDACWSHPFLDVAHLPTVGDGRSADDGWRAGYLDAWRAGWRDTDLRAAVELAVVVDRVFQAVTYEDLQRSLEPAAQGAMTGVQARVLTRVAELAAGIS